MLTTTVAVAPVACSRGQRESLGKLKGGNDQGWPNLGAETSCATVYPCESNRDVVVGIC